MTGDVWYQYVTILMRFLPLEVLGSSGVGQAGRVLTCPDPDDFARLDGELLVMATLGLQSLFSCREEGPQGIST